MFYSDIRPVVYVAADFLENSDSRVQIVNSEVSPRKLANRENVLGGAMIRSVAAIRDKSSVAVPPLTRMTLVSCGGMRSS